MAPNPQHPYTSTACTHEQCGSCRQTCKFCGSPCQHGCRYGAAPGPAADVDQAREIARQMWTAMQYGVWPELAERIRTDPALFWLRGEEQPPGVHPG